MPLRVRGNLRIGPLLPCDGSRKRRLRRLASGKASGHKTLPNPFQYAEIIAGDRMGRAATQTILPLPCWVAISPVDLAGGNVNKPFLSGAGNKSRQQAVGR